MKDLLNGMNRAIMDSRKRGRRWNDIQGKKQGKCCAVIIILTVRVLGERSRVCAPDMTIEEFLEWYTERRIQSVGFLWNKRGGARHQAGR